MEKFPEAKEVLKKVNPLKSEHLKSGISPIWVCFGEYQEFEGDLISKGKLLPKNPAKTEEIFFPDSYQLLKMNGEKKHGGMGSYSISHVNNFDKVSYKFANCTGVVMAGKKKETGENISFLSHQYPIYFLYKEENRQKFINDLIASVQEIKEKSEDGSVDAVIFSGNYKKDDNFYKKEYQESIGLLSKEIGAILGFEPVVIVGPKVSKGIDHVYYLNDERKLFFFRNEENFSVKSREAFLPSELEKKEKEWQQET